MIALSTANKARGFTLIELMIVVVIIGVMAGLTSMSVGGNDMRRLQSEAKRLNRLLSLAQDEAIFRQQNLGFYLEGKSYSILVFDSANYEWLPLPGTDFKAAQVADGFDVEIITEGEVMEIPLPEDIEEEREDESDEESEARLTPQILLLASGEATPYEVRLTLTNDSPMGARITSDGFNAPETELVTDSQEFNRYGYDSYNDRGGYEY
jgi:general secretion pathway protein H